LDDHRYTMNDLKTLLSTLLCGKDEQAETAAQQIATYGAAAIPALKELLVSADPDTRWWALRVLAEIEDPQVLPLLQSSLHDPDPAVRQCAALALRQHPSPQVVPDLIDCLAASDRLLAHLAAEALIAAGPEAVPALLETMQNGSQAARLKAVRALALLEDQRAIPILFQALDDESALVAHWADEGLQRMGVGMSFFKPGA
jgi:HEAT repeat protein